MPPLVLSVYYKPPQCLIYTYSGPHILLIIHDQLHDFLMPYVNNKIQSKSNTCTSLTLLLSTPCDIKC